MTRYGKTCAAVLRPWGLFVRKGTRLLCADGKIRSVSYIAQTADTFFSVPASVKVNGKSVSGYATCEEGKLGRVWAFRHHTKHADKLPTWPDKFTSEHEALISSAFCAT